MGRVNVCFDVRDDCSSTYGSLLLLVARPNECPPVINPCFASNGDMADWLEYMLFVSGPCLYCGGPVPLEVAEDAGDDFFCSVQCWEEWGEEEGPE